MSNSTDTADPSDAALLAAADAAFRYYAYDPNLVLPIIVAALFGIASAGHIVLMVRKRSWYMWPFVLATMMEGAGYALRRISANHVVGRQDGLVWFISSSLCIILAPALMAATHYMIFGRLIAYVGEEFSPVRAKRVTLIFVIFDVLSFLVQGYGGSLFASENADAVASAPHILIVGFLIQIVSFGIFGMFALVYQIRAKRAGEAGEWKKGLYTLYLGCALILIRSTFRTLEFGMSKNGRGYLLDHEASYYALETVPILLVVILFLFSHPACYIPSDRSLRLHSLPPRATTMAGQGYSNTEMTRTGRNEGNNYGERSKGDVRRRSVADGSGGRGEWTRFS